MDLPSDRLVTLAQEISCGLEDGMDLPSDRLVTLAEEYNMVLKRVWTYPPTAW